MKKFLISLLCLVFLFITIGCQSQEQQAGTPIDPAVSVPYVRNEFDKAREAAREVYAEDPEKLASTLEWINKGEKDYLELRQQTAEYEEWRNEQLDELNPSRRLQIQSDHGYETIGNFIYISGRVKNISSKDISYFQVIVKMLDSENRVLHSEYTTDRLKLSPGEMREFEIRVRNNDDYQKYELSIGDVR